MKLILVKNFHNLEQADIGWSILNTVLSKGHLLQEFKIVTVEQGYTFCGKPALGCRLTFSQMRDFGRVYQIQEIRV